MAFVLEPFENKNATSWFADTIWNVILELLIVN